MPGHLTEEQWNAAVLGAANDAVRGHIENCDECQAEERELEGAFAALRDSLSSESERPEAFWQRQRAMISARLSLHWFIVRHLVWATAVAVVALAAATLLRQAPPAHVTAPDPDQALLMDVDRSVDSGIPEALAPAALLTQEINRAAQTNSGPKSSDSRKGEHRP